jgi:DNA polymerase III epsilon subunit-like protein
MSKRFESKHTEQLVKYVFSFDLETSGLPKQPEYNKYYTYTDIASYASSRVVQIGYTVHKIIGDNHVFVKEAEYIIVPRGFKIDNERFHGINHSYACDKGIEFKDAIALMSNDLKKTNLIVAHNAGFDVNVLLSEMWRRGLKTEAREFAAIPYFCTSIRLRDTMKLPMMYRSKNRRNIKYKQPNLGELHKWLFKKDIPDEDGKRHTALFDSQILSKCFLEMLKKKMFVLA